MASDDVSDATAEIIVCVLIIIPTYIGSEIFRRFGETGERFWRGENFRRLWGSWGARKQ